MIKIYKPLFVFGTLIFLITIASAEIDLVNASLLGQAATDSPIPGGSADSPHTPDISGTILTDRGITQGFSEAGLSAAQSQVSGVQNGGFELGNNGDWFEDSTLGFPVIYSADELNISPFSGEHMAWMGGAISDASAITQFVVLPEGSNLALEYRFRIISDETDCDSEETSTSDFGVVLINDELANWFRLCDFWNSQGWSKGVINLNSLSPGDIIRIDFGAVTDDDSLISSFYIDDVEITFVSESSCLFEDIEPNNTADDLISQGPLPECSEVHVPGTFPDDINSEDETSDFFDAYFLVPTQNTRMDLVLKRIPTDSNYDLFILDSSDTLAVASQTLGNENEIISADLREGELYLIAVVALNSGANTAFFQEYLLTMETSPLSDDYFENPANFTPTPPPPVSTPVPPQPTQTPNAPTTGNTAAFLPYIVSDGVAQGPAVPTRTPTPTPQPTTPPQPTVCNITETEPNNRRSSVTSLMPSCPTLLITGGFANDSEKLRGNFYDTYLFVVEQAGMVSVELSNVPAGHNYDLFITDNPADPLNQQPESRQIDDGGPGEGEAFRGELPAGRYHLTVENTDIDAGTSAQNYQVRIVFE